MRTEIVGAFDSEDVRIVELVFLVLYLIAFLVRLRVQQRRLLDTGCIDWQPSRRQGGGVNTAVRHRSGEETRGRSDKRLFVGSTGLRGLPPGPRPCLKVTCLVGFCTLAFLAFILGPSRGRESSDAVVLFWGLVIGHGFLLVKTLQSTSEGALEFYEDVLGALVLLFTLSVLVRADWWQPHFQYRGHPRWQGLWWNPNTFGLLMATGMVLAAGLHGQRAGGRRQGTGVRGRESRSRWRVTRIRYWLERGVLALAVVVMGVGLVKSYSRAAWVGLVCGLVYLVWNSRFRPLSPLLVRNRLPLAVTLAAVAVLAFWQYRNTERPVVRRALSVGNVNDLSWRNRLVAYESALQMMTARPWFGLGWNQVTETYDTLFKPAKVVEPMAIELNDYFMIGLTLGLPALVCFVGYIWLSFAPRPRELEAASEGQGQGLGKEEPRGGGEALKVVCRAGVIVLLVGFWLQRGVFFLSLGVPFWVLLELGSEESPAASEREWTPINLRGLAASPGARQTEEETT